jgi:hypothetical protein
MDQSALELIFRSNVTPEITIDLSSLVSKQDPKPDAVSGSNKLALQFIKPEILIQALGVQKSIAPYGEPSTGMYTYVLGGLASAALIGGLLTYGICRDPKTWTPVTGLVAASFLGFIVYYQGRLH